MSKSRTAVVDGLVARARTEADRRAAVTALRAAGMTWRQVGNALGIDHAWVYRRYAEAEVLAGIPAQRQDPDVHTLRVALTRGLGCRCGEHPSYPVDRENLADVQRHAKWLDDHSRRCFGQAWK